MSDLSISIDANVLPLQNSLKKADKALENTATKAKKEASKIDEAFKKAAGKVEESMGPLGKLLGPTALGVGVLGLALGALGAAAAKAFSAVKEGAAEIKNLGTSSGFSAAELGKLTSTAAAAETSFTRLRVAIGLAAAGIVESMTPAVDTMADFFGWVGTSGADIANMGAEGFAAGARRGRTGTNKALDEEARVKARQAELKRQREEQDAAAQRFAAAAKLRADEARRREDDAQSALMSGARMAAFRREFQARTPEVIEAELMRDLSRFTPIIGPIRDVTPRQRPAEPGGSFLFDGFAPELSGVATSFGSALGNLGSAVGRGAGVHEAIGSGISGIASMAASALLGPVAGPIVGGVIDGLVGAISNAFGGENEASKARREAKEAMRKQWLRDTAAARRNKIPGFDPFLGRGGGAANVTVNFNGPVGSPARIARSIADSMVSR